MTERLTSSVGASYLDGVDLRVFDTVGTLRSFGQEVSVEFGLPNDMSLPVDMLTIFSKAAIEIASPEQMEPTHLPYYGAMGAIIQAEAFVEVRDHTVTDPSLAVFAAETMRQTVLDYLRSGDDNDTDTGTAAATASIAAAVDGLLEDIELVGAMTSGFGVDDVDEWEELPFNERLELVKKMQSRVGRLRRLLGRINTVANARPAVTRSKSGETVDMVMGNELTMLSSTELVNMATPALAPDFWARWADNAVLVRRKKDTRPLGNGPIILVGDESGSMSDHRQLDGYLPLDWLKAILVTMHKTGRPCTYLPFGSTVGDAVTTGDSVADYTRALCSNRRGGTNIKDAMDEALKLAGDTGDIVLVTDGVFALDDQSIQEIADAPQRVTTIIIGYQASPSAVAFSDTCITVSELTAETVIEIKEATS